MRAGAIVLLALGLAIAVGGPPRPAAAQDACQFTLGFKDLHDLLPEVVGDCTGEATPQEGGLVQQTTRGWLIWRQADNWTAFTDGAWTWINGPCGLQSRANDQTLPFERGEPCEPPTPTPIPPPAAPPTAAPPPTSTPPPPLTAADLPEQLRPAWALLQATATHEADYPSLGALASVWLNSSRARVVVAAPPPGAWGIYSGRTNTVTLSPEVAGDLPAAAAAVLFHELLHSWQRFNDPNIDCEHREEKAMLMESSAWELMTNGGVAGPYTALQVQENRQLNVVKTQGEPGLYGWVVNNPGYQQECALWTPA